MNHARATRAKPAALTDTQPALAIRHIQLRDFRNYPRLDLPVDARPVVLCGENGAGKTNLLEALSLLAPGRGLRRARLDELNRVGGGPFHVACLIDDGDGQREIVVSPQGERRHVAVDDRPLRSQTELAAITSLVWLVPGMDRLFVEGPSERRRFVDRLVLAVFPDHAHAVAAFERAMRERSRLLREGRRDPAWLTAVERRMVEAGVAVAAARREFVRDLDRTLGEAALPFPHPRLDLAGDVEGWLDELPAVEVEERFAAALEADRRADAETGGAGVGPHRSDLVASDAWIGDPAERCSTGRQKAFLVAILVAEAMLRRRRHGDLPLMLLDEVTAHLDWRRRRELFEILLHLGAQCWITGTDHDLFMALRDRAQFFTVANGTLAAHD